MTNLLKNGSFEKDWGEASSHTCLVIDRTGDLEYKEIGNIFTPPNWMTWFKHIEDTWDQPEVRDVHASQYPERVFDGEKSMLMFSFFRHHDGGFFQRLAVKPDTRLRVCGFAHAWSNSKDGPHPDNGNWSEGPGFDGGYMLEGNAPNDDWRNFTFYLGFDPFGGVNPYADTVVWAKGAHVYNEYAQLPGIEMKAKGEYVTVFLRCRCLWPFKHNDAYFDKISLSVVDIEPKPYKSTMLILPQSATREQLVEVFETAYPKRRTFGFSYDDGGHLNGTVVLYNIPTKSLVDFETYYAQRYPNVKVEFAYTSDFDPNQNDFGDWSAILLGQRDDAWKDIKFGSSDCGSTIGAMGCYITNIAMAQRIYLIDKGATPVTVDEKLGPTGYVNGCLARWDAIKNKCNIHITASGDIDKHLENNGVAMIEVQFPNTGGQHFVLAVNKRDNDYVILDPWYREVNLLSKRYNSMVSYRLLSAVGNDPPPPPPKKTCNYVGLHQQTMAVGAREYHSDLRPGISKVFTLEDVEGVLRWSPDTPVVFRHFNNNSAPFLSNPDKLAGANAWIDQFRDSMYRVCDRIARDHPDMKPPYFIVESTNEDYPSANQSVISNVAAFDTAFVRALADTGYPVAAGVFNAAVGNPKEDEFYLLEELGRVAMQYGAYFGYHNYWPGNPMDGGPACLWRYLAGRFEGIDDYLTARGIYVGWYGGESGVVGGEWGDTHILAEQLSKLQASKSGYKLYGRARFHEVSAPYGVDCSAPVELNSTLDVKSSDVSTRGWVYLKPHSGWMSSDCYDHNWPRYLADIVDMNERLRVWNLTHQNRYLGIVLFTTGAPYMGWKPFQIQHEQMGAIKAALACNS